MLKIRAVALFEVIMIYNSGCLLYERDSRMELRENKNAFFGQATIQGGIMKRIFIPLLLLIFSAAACAPVTLQKCVKEYKYNGDKVTSEYTECLSQTPEKTTPVHLKHQELYE